VPSSELEMSSQRAAVQAIASFAAEEFERIAALSQTLRELMKSRRFYDSPTLAAAQLSVITELAEAASVSVDQMAANVGIERDKTDLQSLLDVGSTCLRGAFN